MTIITDGMWWKMCDCCMQRPVPLAEAIINRGFVYSREWGLFYVAGSSHQPAMSLLLAWDNGMNCGIDVADHLGLEYSDGTADHWLHNTDGSAFCSSIATGVVIAGRRTNLNTAEKRIFRNIDYLYEA